VGAEAPSGTTENDGKLDLRVNGLVIPGLGTPGPVTTISASLYCGADSNTTAADTTQQVPSSRKGDARIRHTSFSVPTTHRSAKPRPR
jgi:hypothetical protein